MHIRTQDVANNYFNYALAVPAKREISMKRSRGSVYVIFLSGHWVRSSGKLMKRSRKSFNESQFISFYWLNEANAANASVTKLLHQSHAWIAYHAPHVSHRHFILFSPVWRHRRVISECVGRSTWVCVQDSLIHSSIYWRISSWKTAWERKKKNRRGKALLSLN